MKNLALSFLAAAAMAIHGGALAQVELKLGHVGEPGSLFQQSADEYAKRVNAKLAGKVKIVAYGSRPRLHARLPGRGLEEIRRAAGRRAQGAGRHGDVEDLILRACGSEDFREGVHAFSQRACRRGNVLQPPSSALPTMAS